MGRNDQLQRDLIARAGIEYDQANTAYKAAWSWLKEVNKADNIATLLDPCVSWRYSSGRPGYEEVQKEATALLKGRMSALLKESVESLGRQREAKLKELQRLCNFGGLT